LVHWSVHWSYPTDGPLLTSESWSGEVTGTVTHGYDDNFFRNGLQVNSERAVAFGYDGDGLLTQAGSLVLTRDAGNGLLSATTLGLASDTWVFSPFGELESYSAEVDASAAYSVDFVRDDLGRIIEKTESLAGEPPVVTKYDYDPAGYPDPHRDRAGDGDALTHDPRAGRHRHADALTARRVSDTNRNGSDIDRDADFPTLHGIVIEDSILDVINVFVFDD
jgi:hypothetical protein